MAHRAVCRRHGKMTPGVGIGFSKDHFVDSNRGLRTHGLLLIGWTPIHETGVSEDSFNKLSCSDLDLKVTQAALARHKNSTNFQRASECEAQSQLQLAHGARRSNLAEGGTANGGSIPRRRVETHDVKNIVGICPQLD